MCVSHVQLGREVEEGAPAWCAPRVGSSKPAPLTWAQPGSPSVQAEYPTPYWLGSQDNPERCLVHTCRHQYVSIDNSPSLSCSG